MSHKDSADKQPETTETVGTETAAAPGGQDIESDPALNDELGQDWADEGGATPDGPATSSA